MNMPMPSSIELRRAPLAESDKVASQQRFFVDDKKFFLKGVEYERFLPPHQVCSNGKVQRPHVRGKFLFVGNDKFWVRGVTYGAFRPGPNGQEYHDVKVVERDFSLMAANGLNAVRIPHTTPPRELLDIAQKHGLRVMVGLSAEQFAGYLIDRKGAPDIEKLIRNKARNCAGHPALLCYALGNEIAAPVVRWLGRGRVESY